MGSPSVGSERIRSGAHLRMAGLELAKYCGVTEFGATLWFVDPLHFFFRLAQSSATFFLRV
jgi:hypothetical protein